LPVREVEAEGRDRRELDEALGSALCCRVEHPAGAEHVHAPDVVEPAAEADVGGRVDHQVAAGRMLLPGAGLRDVARDYSQRGIRANVHAADLRSLAAVALGQHGADESECTGDENFGGHPGIGP
jgi:hypothetical protein